MTQYQPVLFGSLNHDAYALTVSIILAELELHLGLPRLEDLRTFAVVIFVPKLIRKQGME